MTRPPKTGPRGRGQRRQSGRFRVIAGSLGGRRVEFLPEVGVRPTPDRVRETLFNWLQGIIEGARCLDLFAGSGALGVEALSRGAADCVFVDKNPVVVRYLEEMLQKLDFKCAKVICRDAMHFLGEPDACFDIVFLDPPFSEDILPVLCGQLEQSGCLNDSAHIYMERAAKAGPPVLPENWSLIRSKRAGNVGYHLCVRET